LRSLYMEWRDVQRRKDQIAAIGRMYAGPRKADPRITEPASVRIIRLVRLHLGL